MKSFIEWLTIDGNTKQNRRKVKRGTLWVEKAAYNINFRPSKFRVLSVNERRDIIVLHNINGDRRNVGVLAYKRLFNNYWMENEKK